MNIFIVDDYYIENNKINEVEFNNIFLKNMYDSKKVGLYYDTYNNVMAEVANNNIHSLKNIDFDLYKGDISIMNIIFNKIPKNKKTYLLVDYKNNKIYVLPKIDKCNLENTIYFSKSKILEKYILQNKENVYFKSSKNNYEKLNSLLYIYYICKNI